MSQFRTATLKLTAWYLAILMTVSLAFSLVIYSISAHELDRPFPPGGFNRTVQENEAIRLAREARAIEGKENLIVNLTILNIATLALGTAASYVFARRTLRPIEAAMEAQSRFVSDASHELRTPLAVMRTENEVMLRDKNPSPLELSEIIKSNLEEVGRLQLLTDRLLALSSQQPVTLSAFAVGDVITEAVRRYTAAAKQKNITLQPMIDAVRATGDADSVCDIVSILIDNAIKYSPSGTGITIKSYEQNRKVFIAVSDEGEGIKDEDQTRIFERFYRADESRTKQHVEGHGLGLALARRLSEQNKAKLAVENHAPHGATFTLELDKA